jgi:hypothetical protein
MNFIVQPQFLPAGPRVGGVVMRHESVLPVAYFVQIPRTVQIKFTSSVAGTLHPPSLTSCPQAKFKAKSQASPELEQGLLMTRIGHQPILLAICLAVDHPGTCGLH